ncbi:hypothetical protein FACS189444_2110 [Spirochaetia bacterium]|nr:hypothetical protein FACS189444_2110 [Spirochaetia bacterium]
MKQKIILISGSPCIGKTTISEKLYEEFNNSAYCDGDWLWCVNPFSIDDPRLREGDKNVSFVLSNYLNLKFDYVFYSSVILTNKKIRESIIKGIEYQDYEIIGFSLMCSEETLFKRGTRKYLTQKREYLFWCFKVKCLPWTFVK